MFDQLDLPLWLSESLTFLTIVIGAVVFATIVLIILNLIKKHFAEKTTTDLDDQIVDALKKPIYWCMILAGVALALKRLESTFPDAKKWIFKSTDGIVYVALAVIVTFLLLRLVKIFTTHYSRTLAAKTGSAFDDQMMPLVNRILKIIVLVIGLVTVLDHFAIDVKGLIAVLGVGSLAIALAAQDTVANMISGFIIMLDRPFRRGDRVTLPSGETCDVFDIGLRSSKFLTFDNTLIVVPNHELVKGKITNLSYPQEEIRVTLEIGVAYGSDIDKVKAILVSTAASHPNVLKAPAPQAFLKSFGESSIVVLLVCRVEKVTQQWSTGEELRCSVYKAFRAEKIEIPFPQRVIYLHQASDN